MKKGATFLLIIILLICSFILSAKSPKIDKGVLSEIQEEGSVKIIADLKDKSNLPDAEIEHRFEDKVSLEVNLTELKKLEKDKNIESIELVGEKKLFLPQSVPLINATTTWIKQFSGINLTGLGETACILDTGTNLSHADLIGKNATCVIDCTDTNCFENCSESDFNGHGTHIAGIIAANGTLKGIAPEGKFIPVKVCTNVGGSAVCYDDDIRAGLDWCISNSSTYNISVISISLGSSTLYSTYCDYQDDPSNLTLGINNAIAKNISVIVATGNDANSTAIASPACIQNATAVGDTYDANVGLIAWTACTDTSTAIDQIVCHSNRNLITDLFAPGALINSTWKDGKYYQTGGTSMAAPHIAGAILLINQYKKLESNKTLTPQTIQNALNSTGKSILDSSSGLNFSRVNILAAILELDEKAPVINLTSPSGLASQTENITFICNATDELQLANITLKIWNSSLYLINDTTVNSSSDTYSQLQTNVSLAFGTYSWTCLAIDRKLNQAYASSNLSLSVGGTYTVLNSPEDNYYTNKSENNFTCTAQSHNSLTNVTFYLWNSTNSLVYNLTQNISGTENQTTRNYTFTREGNYTWNCLSINNDSNSSTAVTNRTLIYDGTKPNITLISPSNGDSSNTGTTTVTFSYNITEQNPSNCSLVLNNAVQATSTSVNTSTTNTFSKSLSAATYYWNITCTDKALNIAVSETRSITINAQTSSGSSSGGGGGGGNTNTPSTIYVTSEQLTTGTTKTMKTNDKLKLNLTTEQHTLTMNQVGNDSAKITIESNPIQIELKKGVIQSVNLNNDDTYDLQILLSSTTGTNADIYIKKISEKIPTKFLLTNNTEGGSNQAGSNEESQEKKEASPIKLLTNPPLIIAIVVISIILLVIAGIKLFHALKKEKSNQKNCKEVKNE